jgi:hypothetical protein
LEAEVKDEEEEEEEEEEEGLKKEKKITRKKNVLLVLKRVPGLRLANKGSPQSRSKKHTTYLSDLVDR